MDISVVLATFNRAASLRIALESFRGLTIPPDLSWELVVVDNNSTDHTWNVVEQFAQKSQFPVRYVFEDTQGRSAALNAGIVASKGQIIAFTDDDITVHPEWLVQMKRTFAETSCAAFAGRVVPTWAQKKPAWLTMDDQLAIVRFDLGEERKEIEIPPLGANCAFQREVFARHGFFRLDLGVTGEKHTITCDDTEFGERLIRAGEKIVYCPTAIVFHPVNQERATKKYFLSWYYYNGRSLTRTVGLPSEGTFYFGVPRWLFRQFGRNLTRWWFCIDDRRFHRKLHALRSLGNIVESHRLSRLKHSAPQSSIRGYYAKVNANE